MAINKSEKQELLEKLNLLLQKQSLFQQEINELQLQITQLKVQQPIEEQIVEPEPQKVVSSATYFEEIQRKTTFQKPAVKKPETKERSWNKSGLSVELEKFIGENLINKIGMAVVIIGVGIGTKYAIDNDLISPLVRIILGYLLGAGLTFFAIRLKKKYFNFSAVLFSGAMAIHYFITYAAYSYYNLFPQALAIILMVLITIATVALALYYDRQVIAHFGLVGAYIIPYLLKDPFQNATLLFIYMLIINAGILFISTKKRWKPLNYLAFIATWTIFISWFASSNYNDQTGICLTFSFLFFLIFYTVFLSYKLMLKEIIRVDDIVFLMLNSLIFYMIGVNAIKLTDSHNQYLGLFTIINAAIHGLTTFIMYKSEMKDKNLLYWLVGLAIAFFTLAIPTQFERQLTIVLFSFEAAFIFWFGRSKKIVIFDYFAFAIIVFSFWGLFVSRAVVLYNFHAESIKELTTPIFSYNFLAAVVVLLSFAFIYAVGRKMVPTEKKSKDWLDLFNTIFAVLFLSALFFTFYIEISLYWNNIQVYTSYQLNFENNWVKSFGNLNEDVFTFKKIWLINYSLLFTSLLTFVNFKWIKNKAFNISSLVLSGTMILIFLLSQLSALENLRTSYLANNLPSNYDVSIFHLLIRYVTYLFFVVLMFSTSRFCISQFSQKIFKNGFEVVLSVSIIWILSSELIQWLNLSGTTEVYKFGLSVLWGVLSFILIGYGIWKKKKHLRLTSIVLFGGTIIKLFTYDLTNLETIPKTIVFLSIGILLLVVSFMYNKYRDIIFGND